MVISKIGQNKVNTVSTRGRAYVSVLSEGAASTPQKMSTSFSCSSKKSKDGGHE